MLISKKKVAFCFSTLLLTTSALAETDALLLNVCSKASGYVRLECKPSTSTGPTHEIKSGPDESYGESYQTLKSWAGKQTTLSCAILVDGVKDGDLVTGKDGGSVTLDLSKTNVVTITNQKYNPISGMTDFDGNPITGAFSFLPPPNNAISYKDTTCPFK
jgi:hypothetical protein